MIKERRVGNSNLGVLRTYDPFSGRPTELCAGLLTGGCSQLKEQYRWDTVGNLLSRDKGTYKEEFRYDALNRLTEGRFLLLAGITHVSGTGPISTALTYDKLGNICSKTINGTAQAYSYGGRAGCGLNGTPGTGTTSSTVSPHQVSLVAGLGAAYQYDARGNQTLADYTDNSKDRNIRYNAADQAIEIAKGPVATPSLRTRFWYGSDGQRYRREDVGTGIVGTRITRYIGNVEVVVEAGVNTVKRQLAGVLQERKNGVVTDQVLLTDHLGSLVKIVGVTGNTIARMDFAAFGERRSIDDPRQYGITPPAQTTRGFTGHEHVDGLDVIHMNGRIYDPTLGRFLQADPIVQDPSNGQNFNRYTYVWNNPLAFTDPTGYASKALGWLRTIASIAINVFLPGAGFFIGIFGSGMTGAMVAGFISGVVGSGTMKGGLVGAFSAGLFFKIGSHFGEVAKANADAGLKVGSNGLTAGQTAAKVLAHGMAGGVMSILQGGKFGHGFASAGFTQAMSGKINGIDKGNTGVSLKRALAAAMVGGTASAATGGKFANGAITGAFSRVFNDEVASHKVKRDHKLFLVAEKGAVGHVFVGGVTPDGDYEAWGFYPSERNAGALVEGEALNGIVNDDSRLLRRALAGDRNFAFRMFDVTATQYRQAMSYITSYSGRNDYGLFTNSCVSAAFSTTGMLGLTPNIIPNMPAVHPNYIYSAFTNMPSRVLSYKHETWD